MIASRAEGKSLRRPVRRRVTLIAAFRTDEGIAICADSQETSTYPEESGGSYSLRKQVEKLAPIIVGPYQLLIAGSGDASMIEGFIIRVERRFKEDTSPASIERARELLEQQLFSFYQVDTPLYGSEASLQIFIAVSCSFTKQCEVWVSEKHLLRPLRSNELIGWNHEYYKVTATRLYKETMSLTQAILAAVHVLVVAEESSNYIRGPFDLAIVRSNGISIESNQYVEELRGRLRELEKYTNSILLACADTSIYAGTLEQYIVKFASIAKQLHEKYIDTAAAQMVSKGLNNCSSSISKVPSGLLIELLPDGTHKVRQDVNGIEEMSRRINEALMQQGDGEVES